MTESVKKSGIHDRFKPAEYDSRFDRFRRAVTPSVPVNEWARQAGLKRSAFNRQRLRGSDPRSVSVANLVRTASRFLGRTVMASEMFDLGEETPVGECVPDEKSQRPRREFDSRLRRTLVRIGIGPAKLQQLSGVTKTSIYRICHERVSPRISIVRSLVIGLRRAGYDVHARDIVDVGDDPPRSTKRDKSGRRGHV